MKKQLTILSLMIFVMAMFSAVLIAGPTVIRDNRVTDLATTPVLGRGYSIATNTYQSTCLKDVVMTEPSYDFTYTFQEMDSFMKDSSSETNTLTKLATTSFRNYLVKKEVESQKKKERKQQLRPKRLRRSALLLQSFLIHIMHLLTKVSPDSVILRGSF